MKSPLLAFLLVVAGCAANPKGGTEDRGIVGSFCHSSIDAALCLELKEDHTYAETFSGGGVIILGPNGEIPKITPEPRGTGRWQRRPDEVVLFPSHGRRRVLKIGEIRGAVVLLESRNGKMIREYRK